MLLNTWLFLTNYIIIDLPILIGGGFQGVRAKDQHLFNIVYFNDSYLIKIMSHKICRITFKSIKYWCTKIYLEIQ